MAMPAENQPGTVLDAAHRYAALGLRVAPIIPGKKHPGLDQWQRAATTDPTIINAWWTGLYTGHGVCIVTGGHLFGVDIDPAAGGEQSADDLQDAYGPLPPSWEVTTGSGGRHVYYWAPVAPTNSASSKLGPGIDIRGEGGQLVAPPTIHPNGRPYQWVTPPWAQPLADAPGWLLALLAVTPTVIKAAPPTTSLDDDSIAATLNREHTWDQLLTGDGWTSGDWRNKQRPWRRPGKTGPGGWSAIEHHDGPLNVFTTSVPELQQPWADRGQVWSYSRFGYLAATRHNGDRSETARQARRAQRAQQPTSTTNTAPTPEFEPAADHGWEPVDLNDIIDGDYHRPQPTILRRHT